MNKRMWILLVAIVAAMMFGGHLLVFVLHGLSWQLIVGMAFGWISTMAAILYPPKTIA